MSGLRRKLLRVHLPFAGTVYVPSWAVAPNLRRGQLDYVRTLRPPVRTYR